MHVFNSSNIYALLVNYLVKLPKTELLCKYIFDGDPTSITDSPQLPKTLNKQFSYSHSYNFVFASSIELFIELISVGDITSHYLWAINTSFLNFIPDFRLTFHVLLFLPVFILASNNIILKHQHVNLSKESIYLIFIDNWPLNMFSKLCV